MMIVLSPAKTLDFTSPVPALEFTQPELLAQSAKLIRGLRKLSVTDLQELMHISDKLAVQNRSRFTEWHTPFTDQNARPAVFTFKGDVYLGLKASKLSAADLDFAQRHLRILSGLYGILKPLDLMQAYRLEMGTSLVNGKHRDLYGFWGDKLTKILNTEIADQDSRQLVNLASNEYFNAVHTSKLKAEVITPVFKDFSNGQYRFLSFLAKTARGSMAAFLIKNRINDAEGITHFNMDGYRYSKTHSTPHKPVFLRDKSPADKK
jgi:uncharacterized protein